jgi:pimeloyl-ACP methyl ester carboxylesterase
VPERHSAEIRTTAGGITYHFIGSGDAVVLVHAGGLDRRMWDDLVEPLSRAHQVIRLDLRGCGETPPGSVTFAHPADVAEVIDHIRAGPAHVVGVSMGAGVAAELALVRPDLVRSLVLVSPGGSLLDDPGPAIREFWRAEADAVERGDLAAAIDLNLKTWLDGPNRPEDDIDPDVRRRVADMLSHSFELSANAPGGAELESELEPPAIDRLGDIEIPSLVIAGALDLPAVLDTAAWLAGELPDATLELLPGVGHLLPMEMPDAVAHLVLTFIEGRGFVERARLAAELLSLARRLEAEGIYNGGKAARAAADRELIRAAVERDSFATEPLGDAVESLGRRLRVVGYPARLLDSFAAAADAARTGGVVGIDASPPVRVCRMCGELFVGSPPAVCPTCEAPALSFREQLPVWYLEPMTAGEALEALRAGAARLTELVRGQAKDVLVRPPRPGEWSARETLEHLVGSEELLAQRIERLLTESEPDLAARSAHEVRATGVTSDESATSGIAPRLDPWALLERYLLIRRATLARVAALTPDAWGRAGHHVEFGRVTVLSQAGYFARHEANHTAQVAAAIECRIPGELVAAQQT